MENQLNVEEFMLENVAEYLDGAKQEIIASLVANKLEESGSVTKEQKDMMEAIVEQALIEMSEQLLPEEEDLVITESDYMLTESGELYFVEETGSFDLVATDIMVESDEVEEAEENEEIPAEENEVTEEEVVTESTEIEDNVDSIVASVIARIRD